MNTHYCQPWHSLKASNPIRHRIEHAKQWTCIPSRPWRPYPVQRHIFKGVSPPPPSPREMNTISLAIKTFYWNSYLEGSFKPTKKFKRWPDAKHRSITKLQGELSECIKNDMWFASKHYRRDDKQNYRRADLTQDATPNGSSQTWKSHNYRHFNTH